MKILSRAVLIVGFLLFSGFTVWTEDISFKIAKKYLNLPILHKQEGKQITFEVNEQPKRSVARQVLGIAYSIDNECTFAKYNKSPVINSKEKRNSIDAYDPKAFWYALFKHWVMISNERNGHSIYTSNNLKDWKYESYYLEIKSPAPFRCYPTECSILYRIL